MKTLIITAQPSSKGFVHSIASQYEGTKKTKGDECEILNLYDEENILPFLSFENIREIELPENVKQMQEKISSADELVFIFPLWWGSMPAILKNFFDTVFSSGFAFEYSDGKPTPFLTDKTAKVIITHDAPKWLYFFMGFPVKSLLKKMILGFCGITTTDFITYGSISFLEESKKNKILENITRIALK